MLYRAEGNSMAVGETVNHPAHYGGDTTYEAIKVIEAWELGFSLGNCVKYICRAGRKNSTDELDDLRKALWYLQRHVSNVEKRECAATSSVGEPALRIETTSGSGG